MKPIFTSPITKVLLLVALYFLVVTSSALAQITATEDFENETNTGSFSESGINFTHTFTFQNLPNYGYGGSAKFLDIPLPGTTNTLSKTIAVSNSLNPGVSFKINSFAGYTSSAQGGLPAYNGEVTVSGTPVGSSTPVSAIIGIASGSGSLPAGQTRESNGFVNGLTFTGTALANLYFYELTFTVNDNNANGSIGTRDFSIDHINFTTQTATTNQFSISDASILEGSSGTKFMTFTITRSTTTIASSVQVQSASGTATAGSDYVAFPLTTVNFTAGGPATQTVNVIINGDLAIESDETFTMILSNPSGGTIFDGTGVGTILDDDNITETFEDETVGTATTSFSERGFSFTSNGSLFVSTGPSLGAGGSTKALDTKVGNGGSSGNVGGFYINSAGTSFNLNSVDVYTSNNDGTSGTTNNVSVTFTGVKADGSGNVSYTATIPTISGFNYQTVSFTGTSLANVQLLSVSVSLGSGINYIALDNIKYGTVTFSGTQLSINDVNVLEGTGGGTTTAIFTITRSNNTSAFSVNVASSDLSATTGSDYVTYNSTLNFTSGGPLSQTVAVTILHDAIIEGNETFTMTLSGATNGVLYQKSVGLGTILDDDKVTENFEDETTNATTFSQNSVTFSSSGRLKVLYNSGANNGSGSSYGYLTSGDNASGGSVGKITITSPNTGFKLLQLDMLTYKGISTAATIAPGPVTFIGTLFDGSTVTTTKTITPTSLAGTGFQQNITFTGTPLDNVVLTSLEFVAGGTITTIDTDNFTYVAVTTSPYIEVTDASNNAITNGGTASSANNTDFGVACTGGSVSRTFTIKNTGSVNLTLSGNPLAVLGGPNASQFSITTQPSSPVAANSSTTFTVSYTPTAAGTHTATITLTSNDGTNSPYVINIKGTANAIVAITSQPANATVCAGNSALFAVSASGSGTLSYQWYKGTTALTNGATGNGSSISGATTANLSISNVSPADAASNYNVRISSSTGCTPANSANASLVVNTPPVISTQPASGSSVQVGGSVQVVASVSGQVTTYQWYREGAIVSGQASATLNLTNIQLSQAGSYSLVASNACGSVTSTVFSLSVTALSDLTPLIYARPFPIYGNTPVTVVVDVAEVNSVATNGSFQVRVTRNQKMSLSFDSKLTSVNNRSVQNSAWSFDDSNANYYVLSTSQSIAAGKKLSFGLSGSFTPGASSGTLTVSSMVVPTTLVEASQTNNMDADMIEYFQQ